MPSPDSVSDDLLELHVAVAPWTSKLLQCFGDVSRARRASVAELRAVPGIGPETSRRLRARLDAVRAEPVRRALRGRGVQLVERGGLDYPPELEHMNDPPALLFVRGEVPGPEVTKIAIVGARRCSAYGRRQARRFAQMLAEAGIAVTSGLARGIDVTAQVAALEAGAPVVAVLGSGLDVPYPPEHVEWIERIARQGAVVSEYPLGAPPRPEHFPWRNRIISGLARGVIVVEATLKSGSLITARWALEQGREVWAVPGPIESEGSSGPHALLRDGAWVLAEREDLAAHLPELAEAAEVPREPNGLEAEPRRLLDLITDGPRSADALARLVDAPVERVLTLLLELEVGGWIERVVGGRFARR